MKDQSNPANENLSCPNCGESVRKKWEFCPFCGFKLPNIDNEQAKNHSDTSNETSPTFIEPVTDMEFVLIPEGTFLMGDIFGGGIENETPVHQVQLDGFYLGRYLVTQKQWKQVMQVNPSKFQRGDDYPVEQITWDDVQIFISHLSRFNQGKYSFRLPTEAEWEYAARSGGKQEKYSGGNEVNIVAWYEENSNGSTHPVGKKLPNASGLFDMSGNVWEWCQDNYSDKAYESHSRKNPILTETRSASGEYVIRGGSWNLDAWSVRCSRRLCFSHDYCGSGLGFRLVASIS